MTRGYTLDNRDGHLSKFESHRRPQAVRGEPTPLETPSLPVSITSDFQKPTRFSSNSKASVVEEGLNYGRSRYSGDALNERPHNNIPHTLEKKHFELSDTSDTDLISDIVTDALHPSSSGTRGNDRFPSIPRNRTRHSPSSAFPPNPEMFVPSPALTVHTISSYTADAHGEEEDEDVVIVDRIQTSFPPKNKPFDEAPIDTYLDSLFTPPPSEAAPSPSESPLPSYYGKKSRTRISASPPPRKIRIVASHVLVPPLSRPKSEYVNLSSLIKPPRIRPHRTAQDRLKDVMNAVWINNEGLEWSSDGDGRKKKGKRKRKRLERITHPIPASSQLSSENEKSVVFVNMKVKHLVEERPYPAETTVIDLTLDDDEEHKPLNLLSPPTQTANEVDEETFPGLQPSTSESRICVGVVHAISYKTLLHNTRFLRCKKGHTDSHEDFVSLDLLRPFRRRRALLENIFGGSSVLNDEFSLGFPVVTGFEIDEFSSDDDDSGYDVIELLDSSPAPEPVLSPGMRPPPPTQVVEPLQCPPKIDLAAKLRKKKSLRPSSVLTPVKQAALIQPTSAISRSPVSLLKNGRVLDVAMDEDGYDPRTPLVPSAKALGKRKAVESSPLQTMQLRPDVQSSFPSSQMENIPSAADNSFDSYINYWPLSPVRPMQLNSDIPSTNLGADDPYAYPDPYPVSNFNFVDHRQHHSPSYSSIEPPPASLLYHSDGCPGTPDDFGGFPGNVLQNPPPSETPLLHAWPAEMDIDFPYDNGTINPSLLGGEPLGILEHPEPYFPEVGSEFVDTEKEPQSSSISMSPSHSPSPMVLSTSPKSESLHPVLTGKDADSGTIFIRPPTSFVKGHSPSVSKRRHIQRLMPDMVPFSVLSLSSSSSSEETEDESRWRPSIKSRSGVRPTLSKDGRQRQQQTKTRPTVARKTAAVLPADLNGSGPKVMIGGQLWPMQDEAAYCHQCRNKTMALKLGCPECKKEFCVRCLTLRYPDEPRALRMKKVKCPACHDYCNCTSCCKKRGVQYISTKDALAGGVVSQAQLKAPKKAKSKFSPPVVSCSSSLSPVPDATPPRPASPLYSLPHTPTGGEYWGVVYGADGSKIGTGYSFAKEGLRERRSPAVPTNGVYWGVVYGADGSRIGKSYTFPKEDVGRIISAKPVSDTTTNVQQPRTKQKRVYVGKVHPSWRFDNAVKKRVLDPVPPPKRVHESRRPRKYVGNKAFLFYKSEKMARELADLSPLSSLEEDWDEEDRGPGVVPEEDSFGIVGNSGNEYREDSQEGSLKSLSDQDVMRAIGLGLHACGIQLAG